MLSFKQANFDPVNWQVALSALEFLGADLLSINP